MSIVEPYPARFITEEDGTALRIILPVRKNWFIIVFLGFWLSFWALGEIMAVGMMVAVVGGSLIGRPLAGEAGGPIFAVGIGLFMLAWLAGWTAGGLVALVVWLYQVTGKEVIEASREAITLSQAVAGFSRPRQYLAQHIKELRINPVPGTMWRSAMWAIPWGSRWGALAFDYGAKTIYFAGATDQAEARQILDLIGHRYAVYSTKMR